ncbi:gustatory receptor 64c [Dermacentor variabilis]|uniref:gustatory receptor 64c n=1 Tax=Dermacentor variabilis TaxID=34621 RepID=UPI003F5B2C70
MHASIPAFVSAALSIVTALAAAAVTAWDSAPGILAKCFAELFVQHLRAENRTLSAAAHGQMLVVGAGGRSDDLRTVLTDCRANMEAVLRMVGAAQGLLGTLLLLSFGVNMGVVCAVLYSLTDSSTPTGLLMSGILYSSLNFADALDVAFASESLANEVAEMKWTLRSLPFQGHPDEFARDVRSFHEILDPSTMFLRAHGFFRVNMEQMISMCAAVITYTVILIQTSQSVKG